MAALLSGVVCDIPVNRGVQVAVVGDGNKVVLKSIQLGRDFGDTVEVKAGLSPQDARAVFMDIVGRRGRADLTPRRGIEEFWRTGILEA